MKSNNLFFSAVLVPLDYLMLILAGLSAYFLRYQDWVQDVRPVIFNLDFISFLNYILWIALIWLIFFVLAGLYQIKNNYRLVSEFNKIFLACSTGMLAVIVAAFFSRELFDSRFILLMTWILSIFYIFIMRSFVRFLQKKITTPYNLVLIGQGKSAQEIILEIKNKQLKYNLINHLLDYSLEKLQEILNKTKIDEIILTDSNISKSNRVALLNFAEKNHIAFKYTADILPSTNFEILTLVGVPIVEVKKTKLDGWGKILKRLFDLIISFILLIILSPLFLIFALIIKIDSRGPIFYGSLRISNRRHAIKIWKFRSMIINADKLKSELEKQNERADGPLFKIKNDPRITRFGKFIRRWSIDELPQLLNVFKGEMSLVGPRPHEPHEVDKYKDEHQKLLNIKPGMTGMAQVSGRSNLGFDEEARLDIFYIENWSPKLDFIILLKTPLVVFKRQGAE